MQEVHEVTGRRSLLVVAGPGRSGTSLFTGLVSRLGLYIPRPEVEANRSNPRGFSEPRWAVEFHKELLAAVDVGVEDSRPEAWDKAAVLLERPVVRDRLHTWLAEQFEQSDRVVIKDPRLAWFLDLYRAVAADLDVGVSVVTLLRHPTETMRSREIAYGTGANSTTRLAGWINLIQSVEERTRELPRATVRYDDLLTDWSRVLAACEEPLHLPLVSTASEEDIADANGLVDVSLRRSTADWEAHDVASYLRDLGQRTYDAMASSAVTSASADPAGDRVGDTALVDGLREEYVRLYHDAEAIARSSIAAARTTERRKANRKARALASEQGARASAVPAAPTASAQARPSGPGLSLRRVTGAVRRHLVARRNPS